MEFSWKSVLPIIYTSKRRWKVRGLISKRNSSRVILRSPTISEIPGRSKNYHFCGAKFIHVDSARAHFQVKSAEEQGTMSKNNLRRICLGNKANMYVFIYRTYHWSFHGGLQFFYWVRSDVSLWRRLWLPISVHILISPAHPTHAWRDRPPHRELRPPNAMQYVSGDVR